MSTIFSLEPEGQIWRTRVPPERGVKTPGLADFSSATEVPEIENKRRLFPEIKKTDRAKKRGVSSAGAVVCESAKSELIYVAQYKFCEVPEGVGAKYDCLMIRVGFGLVTDVFPFSLVHYFFLFPLWDRSVFFLGDKFSNCLFSLIYQSF
jgi:hypothetical protein